MTCTHVKSSQVPTPTDRSGNSQAQNATQQHSIVELVEEVSTASVQGQKVLQERVTQEMRIEVTSECYLQDASKKRRGAKRGTEIQTRRVSATKLLVKRFRCFLD